MIREPTYGQALLGSEGMSAQHQGLGQNFFVTSSIAAEAVVLASLLSAQLGRELLSRTGLTDAGLYWQSPCKGSFVL